ncbi:23768_t:CDS:1, partial [Racocetra persica]
TCTNCAKRGLRCAFVIPIKKRGPKPRSRLLRKDHQPFLSGPKPKSQLLHEDHQFFYELNSKTQLLHNHQFFLSAPIFSPQ